MEKIRDKKLRILVLLVLPLVIFWDFHWFEPAAKKNSQGIKAYNNKDYKKSLQLFLEAKGLKNSAQIINNTASSLYQLKQFDLALNEYAKIDLKKRPGLRQEVYYNMGNVFYKMKKYKEALNAYKESLILNQNDMDAKKNYELTLKKIKEQNKKKNKDNQDKKKQDKKKKQKKDKHKNLMKYLNQNEKKQLKNKKRKVKAVAGRRKDW
jgi:tetratricopeptide (TPR) repeat protein